MRRGGRKVASAARVGARVNVEGVRSIVAQFDTLLTKLKAVRAELKAINAEGGAALSGAGGGVGVGASSGNMSTFGSMVAGFGGGARNIGGFLLGGGGLLGGQALGMLSGRFDRNMQQSTSISGVNALTSSMYSGFSYGSMERDYLKNLGKFAGTREQAGSALQTALGFGMTSSNAMSYLQNVVAPMVQASGGTMTSAQASASGGTFLDPYAMRRASQLGITPGKVNGVVGNPKQVAMGYLKDFEKRNGARLNEIDFANMRSPGSPARYAFKRLYQLSDEAIDMVIEAGMQNNTFYTANKRDIDFSSNADLNSLGMTDSKLAIKAQSFMSTVSGREANFFANQEGNMVGRLNSEEFIQKTLGELETKFGDVIGTLYKFERALVAVTTVMSMMGGASLLFGRGGGGVGLPLPGGGGGGPMGGPMGGAGGIGMARMLGGSAMLMGGMGAASMAGGFGASGNTTGGLLSVGGGGILAGGGAAMLGAGPVGIAAAAGLTVAYGAKKFADGKHSLDRQRAGGVSRGMSEQELIATFHDYINPGWFRGNGGAGPRQTANFDEWQRRRGAMLATMFSEANQQGMFDSLSAHDASWVGDLMRFYGGSEVTNDDKWFNRVDSGRKFVNILKDSKEGAALVKKFFDTVDPFDFATPVTTPIAKDLEMSSREMIQGGFDPESTGDPVDDHVDAKGATWDRLDGRMKSRLLRMFKDSGGRVRLGNGWRSEDQQRNLFLSRHVQDPRGNISWNGKRWSLKKGMAPAAPPGRSMHEVGLAADLEGDLGWVQRNAAKYGLKTFAGVNNEPWHVQPAELPNSRSEYDGGGGSATDSSMGTTGSTTQGSGFTPGNITAMSGADFSLLSALQSGSRGGGGWAGGGGSIATSGATSLGQMPTGGTLSMQEIAKVAYAAGFRGNDLVQMVAIAQRESGGRSNAFNGNTKTGDQSYGLWQINMLGEMGKKLAPIFGIDTYEQLFDPMTNARAAFTLYQRSGNTLRPWGGYKGVSNTHGADKYMADAEAAVRGAGLMGDGSFAAGPGVGGGGGNVVMYVTNNISASGQLQYDSTQLFDATMARVKEATEMHIRRSS